ncbi:GH36-type glycosyl hydrolase domain-containing protein [Paenibacillus donghaensis]|uniref:Glycosyl transferase n=1 Tax=Paenibacillus donghaensis TaxID=414771 RepID=A0A2Z2KCQ0_9BACL|nr:glycosyl transferase [Paenibacillus donghaensis]ASA23664.1 glycosyl transferase [Paenibacillus donghaensis]
MLTYYTAREHDANPDARLRELFQELISPEDKVDAIYADAKQLAVIGVSGLSRKTPAVLELMKHPETASVLLRLAASGESVLVRLSGRETVLYVCGEQVQKASLPVGDAGEIWGILGAGNVSAGWLNEQGEHVIDLLAPSPGPHFYVNLLLGNRIGYAHPLQTTPKSVVDRFGGGSFRSHAATQVLASRWDMRQEENGFPANRQFYLFENNRQLFYSAEPEEAAIVSAECRHSQNQTVITYVTACGLEIIRTIFILPQQEGLPLATEVQRITIRNTGAAARSLRLVYTGMFGSAAPGALFEDVLYSNVILQGGVLRDKNGALAAVSPDYYPENGRKDLRFHTMLLHQAGETGFATEFCVNYNEFVGNGTLQRPQGALKLSSRLYRKGPGFFAVAAQLDIAAGQTVLADHFTGLVSDKGNAQWDEEVLAREVGQLTTRFSDPAEVEKALEQSQAFVREYSGFLQIHSENEDFNTYVNRNLPFQVLYQSFVSRSFCQTQKGYREIGFREIQDLYASMYYFVGMGQGELVRQLLKEWTANVFEFGFANHNFFWVGKEPGKWSDDALWLVQAVYRYVNLTGDTGFLDEECTIAGSVPEATRSVYKTLQAILVYSGMISVGKHGIPLLDYADWNDCLKLDDTCINGPVKEERYRKQLEKGGSFGDPLESDYSESVMNGFLLKVAMDQLLELAERKGDTVYAGELEERRSTLHSNLQQHAWKGDFFARVLFNRYPNGEYSYLGAGGDGLSADPLTEGSYFLNSFSWSILANCATEQQITTMLDVIERTLKTASGLKLVTPAALGKVSSHTASDEYFPGDRENGGVFKHACMMATTAMFKAARNVEDTALAARLGQLGYWLLDITLPYRTLEAPFEICGNPRFCTQYNNSETGENIGPMLSGTSTWLTLSLLEALGIEHREGEIMIDPILREEEQGLEFVLRLADSSYRITVSKPEGFRRSRSSQASVKLNGSQLSQPVIPLQEEPGVHEVVISFS